MTAKEEAALAVEGRPSRDRSGCPTGSMHNPEVAFEEERSADLGWRRPADGGFDVTTGVCRSATAFVARTGSGPLHIGICAEYDALPGIGHACGHNVIAAAARSAPAWRWPGWPTTWA